MWQSDMGDKNLASGLDMGQGVSSHELHERSKQTDSEALEVDQGQVLPSQIPREQGKKTKNSKSRKARIKRLQNRKACRLQVKRLQQYLGLTRTPAAATGAAVLNAWNSSSSTNLQASMTHPDSYAVLVSVDCEAFEFVQEFVTEIGVSILDTRDIIGVEPGLEGENWICKIKSRHFRTKEHKNRRNKRHVQGCPDNFLFGQSEWISEKDAAEVLEQCFRQSSTRPEASSNSPCKVVFVGHNASADEEYLAALGFNVSKEVVDVIDSEAMAMAVFRETNQPSLGKLLLRYGISGEHFHNAGNDANYTLQLAIAMALREFRSKKTRAEWKVEQDIRVEGAIEKAKVKAVDGLHDRSNTSTLHDTSGPTSELEKTVKIEQACKEAVAKVFADFEGWSTEDDDEIEGSAIVPRRYEEMQAKLANNKRKRQAKSNTTNASNPGAACNEATPPSCSLPLQAKRRRIQTPRSGNRGAVFSQPPVSSGKVE